MNLSSDAEYAIRLMEDSDTKRRIAENRARRHVCSVCETGDCARCAMLRFLEIREELWQ